MNVFDVDSILWNPDIDVSDDGDGDSKQASTDRTDCPFSIVLGSLAGQTKKMGRGVIPTRIPIL